MLFRSLGEYASLYSAFLSKPVTRRALLDAMAHARVEHARSQWAPDTQDVVPDLAERSILLAEDNSLNREVATAMLQKTGARIIEAHNGREAVDTLAEQAVDLVLMDLQMPVMDGFEASRRIRARYPELPILALSAAVMEDDRKRAEAAGMNDHLAKPIEKQTLFRLLAAWLPVRNASTPTPGSNVRTDPAFATEPAANALRPTPRGASSGGAPESADPIPIQPSSVASAAPLPARLEGFDLQRGLARFDQDAALYLSLLNRFRMQLEDDFAGLGEQLDQPTSDQPALDQQAPTTETKHLIHTLKGLASLLGAERLAAAATEIDRLCHRDALIPAAVRADLAQALSQARTGVTALSGPATSSDSTRLVQPTGPSDRGIPEPEPEPDPEQVRDDDPQAATGRIEQMRQALEAGELVDEARIAEVLALVRQSFDDALALELQTHIETFDHDRARELLSQIATRVAERQHEASD